MRWESLLAYKHALQLFCDVLQSGAMEKGVAQTGISVRPQEGRGALVLRAVSCSSVDHADISWLAVFKPPTDFCQRVLDMAQG
jgi:hypothetical protein